MARIEIEDAIVKNVKRRLQAYTLTTETVLVSSEIGHVDGGVVGLTVDMWASVALEVKSSLLGCCLIVVIVAAWGFDQH